MNIKKCFLFFLIFFILGGVVFAETVFIGDNLGNIYVHEIGKTNYSTVNVGPSQTIFQLKYYKKINKLFFLSFHYNDKAGYLNLNNNTIKFLSFPKKYEGYKIYTVKYSSQNKIFLAISKYTGPEMEYKKYSKSQYIAALIFLEYDLKKDFLKVWNLSFEKFKNSYSYFHTKEIKVGKRGIKTSMKNSTHVSNNYFLKKSSKEYVFFD